MVTQDRLAIVDSLLALPFPQTNTHEGRRRSGPGYHVYGVRASRDFWDDRGEKAVEAAEEEIDAAFHVLATALTARWGEPHRVDLEPYLWSEDEAPEPMNQLSQLSGDMFVWRSPGAGRWVALAVGQGDREFPVELVLAIGEVDPLP